MWPSWEAPFLYLVCFCGFACFKLGNINFPWNYIKAPEDNTVMLRSSEFFSLLLNCNCRGVFPIRINSMIPSVMWSLSQVLSLTFFYWQHERGMSNNVTIRLPEGWAQSILQTTAIYPEAIKSQESQGNCLHGFCLFLYRRGFIPW